MFTAAERRYLETARVGRLATADEEGRPHAVPVCFALSGEAIVTPLDEKPKDVPATDLRRVRDVEANPYVALVVDHWREEWDALGWVQVRGRAALRDPDDGGHAAAVAALREKYDQYEDHALEALPHVRIEPGHVVSWGRLERPDE
jgi:PPOX class probable F420-dependent enzyme